MAATLPAPIEGGKARPVATVPLGILPPADHELAGAKVLGVGDLTALPSSALDETTVIRRVVAEAAPTLPPPAIEVSTGSAGYWLAIEPELMDRLPLVPRDRNVGVTIGAIAMPNGDEKSTGIFMKALCGVASTGSR